MDLTKSSWNSMIRRCTDPRRDNYKHYGAKGIKVCKRWMTYENFLSDMGERPSASHTIDRKSNAKGYYKSNCRWALPKEQGRNRTNNRVLRHKGVSKTLIEWSEELGISHTLILHRLKKGWSVGKTLSTPVDHKPKSSLRTHCPNGHPYSYENTWVKKIKGGKKERICRTCRGLPQLHL